MPVCIGWSGNASLVGGRSSGDLRTSPSPWPARSPCLPWSGSDLSPPLCASLLCSRHTGLLAVPQTCQARSFLRTFSLSVPSAQKPLPPDLRMARVLTSLRSLLQCPLLREALPHHPAFSGTATPHTALPLALPCFSSQCILQHNIISCLLVLSLTCKLHEDRDCVLFITVSQCSCQWCLLVHVLSPRFNGNDCGIFFSK